MGGGGRLSSVVHLMPIVFTPWERFSGLAPTFAPYTDTRMNDAHASTLRRLLMALLLLGLFGTTTELLLLKHYERPWMFAPFAVIAIAAAGAIGRLARPSAASVRWLRLSMLPLLAAGVGGACLHYLGGLAFQADMDPTLPRWQLFWKVLRMQAPPMLAPGVLIQLGLLGLASTYRDPLVATVPSIHT
jgi:hypothetical protein